MKKTVGRSLVWLLAVLVMLSVSVPVTAQSIYIHDPMDNPKAAADIVVDPNAVYGYAPNPDSPRLGVYAPYDWSDPVFVAEMREEREQYHESIKELYQIKADMEAQGKTIEEIARAVSIRRNEIRMEAYKDDPEGLEKLKESNLATYGDENGGSPDYFYAKYGSWETVIEKAFSSNAGADAVLGLYDKYYDTYIFDGKTDETDETQATEPATEAPTENETEKPTEAPSTEGQEQKSPQTGDPSGLVILLMLAAAGIAALSAVELIGKKKNAS